MTFASREDAGRKLGQALADQQIRPDLVLGLPRGGVIVAAEAARLLGCPLDVLVVRKIGHPRFREFAVGALGEGGVVVLDQSVLRRARVRQDELDDIIAEESLRLRDYQEKFTHPHRPSREGKITIIIDDGLATGATLEAAVQSSRSQAARRIIAAVPVASTTGAARIARICDEFHALVVDPNFEAVGQYYQSFGQTSDDQVQQVLAASVSPPKP